MRKCSKCQSDQNPFNKDRKAQDGLQAYCRPCSKAIKRAYYAVHGAKHRETSARSKRERQLAAQMYVIEVKKAPCTDCGKRFNPWQMDFDHLEGTDKVDTVTKLAGSGYTLEVVKEEIAKCELVCANCHRDRTFKRGQQSHGRTTLYTVQGSMA